MAPAAVHPASSARSNQTIQHCLLATGYLDVSIHAGDKIRVRAGITPQCGRNGWTADTRNNVFSGPDGLAGGGTYGDALIPSELIGTIVGAFSPNVATTADSVFDLIKSSSPFKVGSSFDGQASVNGFLYLIFNDRARSYWDNGGAVNAKIEISKAGN
jgi:hypothetical protein